MRAKVGFEAIRQITLEGVVTAVNQIPVQQNDRGEDVRYFAGIVKLDRSGEGLKPGMTAMVEIELAQRQNVLAVPHQAIVNDQSGKVCVIAQGQRLERRPVTVGQGRPTLWRSLLDCPRARKSFSTRQGGLGRPRSLSGFDDSTPWPTFTESKVEATPKSAGPTIRPPQRDGTTQRSSLARRPGSQDSKAQANTENDPGLD